jgi:hypothetical protein
MKYLNSVRHNTNSLAAGTGQPIPGSVFASYARVTRPWMTPGAGLQDVGAHGLTRTTLTQRRRENSGGTQMSAEGNRNFSAATPSRSAKKRSTPALGLSSRHAWTIILITLKIIVTAQFSNLYLSRCARNFFTATSTLHQSLTRFRLSRPPGLEPRKNDGWNGSGRPHRLQQQGLTPHVAAWIRQPYRNDMTAGLMRSNPGRELSQRTARQWSN